MSCANWQWQATRVKKIFEKVEYAAVAMCGAMVSILWIVHGAGTLHSLRGNAAEDLGLQWL